MQLWVQRHRVAQCPAGASAPAHSPCSQKPCRAGAARPAPIFGHEREVKAVPAADHPDIKLQSLLPDQPAFDLAVSIVTHAPGAAPATVTTRLNEYGVAFLKGQGIQRLDTDYHPVTAGDVLWIAPFCPQWFAALGKTPTSYICYQDVNRDPI